MGGIDILVNFMTFPLFALLLVTLLDEMAWHLQLLQQKEDAMAEVQAEMAYEQWLRVNDYPDHW